MYLFLMITQPKAPGNGNRVLGKTICNGWSQLHWDVQKATQRGCLVLRPGNWYKGISSEMILWQRMDNRNAKP